MKKTIVLSALALGCACALAQESKWGFVTALGWAEGGEELFSGLIVDRSNAARTIPFTIKSNGGLQIRLGPEYRFSDRLSVQATIGRSVTDPMGDNGSLTYTTTPVELMVNFKPTPKIMVGLGARKTYADMQGTGVAANYPILGSFDGALGSVLEFTYLLSESKEASRSGATFGLHARFVNEKLQFQQYELNGDHYELGMTLRF